MKTLAKILMALVVLVVVLALVSFLLPREVTVTRDKVIKAPVEVVYEQVNRLPNWEDWSYWNTLDTNMEIIYDGPYSGTGSSYSWSGNKDVGQGKLTIGESKAFEMITTELDFGEKGTGSGSWQFSKEGDGTKVVWSFHTDLGMNPMMRWMGLMMDGMLGEAMEFGLNGLAEKAENMEVAPPAPEFSTSDIQIEDLPEQAIYSIIDSSTMADLGAKMGELLPEVGQYAYSSGAEITGMPLTIYHSFGEDMVVLECGISVKEAVAGEGRVKPSKLPAGRTVTAVHNGDYQYLKSTYEAIEAYLQENQLEKNGHEWEVYLNDPEEVAEPKGYMTKVHFPIK